MAKLTVEQNEQYYRVRLDPYKLRHSKGMEHRSICPLHSGSNPTQFWIDFAEGNFCCFSCGEKGPSAYIFEQKMLAQTTGRSPMHDEVMRSLEQVLGTPFVQRTYTEPLGRGKNGLDRKQARDFHRYTDELGDELFTVWRFVDPMGERSRRLTVPVLVEGTRMPSALLAAWTVVCGAPKVFAVCCTGCPTS
jgi:hypothetical protein